MKFKRGMKQKGVIVFGKTLNRKAWIEQAKAEGFVVRVHKQGFATLWK